MIRCHAVGNWPRGAVRTTWTESSRIILPELEQIIERTWADATRRPGLHLFDGPMCRVESWTARDDAIDLTLSRTSYKPFFGTNLHNAHLANIYGPAVLANPLGVSAALETRDGFLMLGRRSASVAYYPDRVHPFAGAPEPREDIDVFDDMVRELNEELSLREEDIADLRCIGLVEDVSLRQPELIFAVRVNRSRAAIESHLDRGEHAGCVAIPATLDELGPALAEPDPYTPVAVASLLLWGRLRYGQECFDRLARRHLAP